MPPHRENCLANADLQSRHSSESFTAAQTRSSRSRTGCAPTEDNQRTEGETLPAFIVKFHFCQTFSSHVHYQASSVLELVAVRSSWIQSCLCVSAYSVLTCERIDSAFGEIFDAEKRPTTREGKKMGLDSREGGYGGGEGGRRGRPGKCNFSLKQERERPTHIEASSVCIADAAIQSNPIPMADRQHTAHILPTYECICLSPATALLSSILLLLLLFFLLCPVAFPSAFPVQFRGGFGDGAGAELSFCN